MKNTFMSYVFGCRVNEAEKQILDQELFKKGFTWDNQSPSFYIINSCAVTGKAEREVRQHIYQTKKKYPHTKILVTGCSATLWLQNNTGIQEVDYWISNSEKKSIPTFLNSITNSKKQQNITSNTVSSDKFLKAGRVVINIQDGCGLFCTYCIVPYLRKSIQSTTTSSVVQQIQSISLPIKEVILTGINTELFGKDTGETIEELLEAILQKTTVPRISFGSIHIGSITTDFLDWYKKNKRNERFIHFFHIPIQSGSDKILKRMNRHYTSNSFLSTIEKLHSINPYAIFSTDVIVGFPGETDEDFKQTYDLLKNSPFSKFHVFRYSPREGTVASSWKDDVDFQIKKERSKQLIMLSKEKTKITT